MSAFASFQGQKRYRKIVKYVSVSVISKGVCMWGGALSCLGAHLPLGIPEPTLNLAYINHQKRFRRYRKILRADTP